MMLPVLLPHCDHPHFCSTCRQLEAGRAFRRDVLARHGINCEVDFECPRSNPWSTSRSSVQAPSRPLEPGPGDRFHKLLMAKYGITPCQRCLEMIDEMNTLGVEPCQQQRTRILNEIWDRRDQLQGWRAIAAQLPLSKYVALRELGGLFDQAMKDE